MELGSQSEWEFEVKREKKKKQSESAPGILTVDSTALFIEIRRL